MVSLDAPNFDHSAANPDGSDLRFYDDEGNDLNFWVEDWNVFDKSLIWVKVPALLGGSSSIWMYYGNPGAESRSDGRSVFDFFDGFDGASIDTDRWSIANGKGWSVDGGMLKGTNNNGRLLTRTVFSSPIIQEVKFRVTQRAPNGIQAAGFYTSNANCFGLLCHPQTDWLRNNGQWINLGGMHIDLHNWHEIRMTTETSTSLNMTIRNLYAEETVYQNVYNNAVLNESICIGRRSDDAAYDQSYEAYWDHVRARKYVPFEPLITVGEEFTNPTPTIVSETISRSEDMLWSSLSVNKDEPGGAEIIITVLDAESNETIPALMDLHGSAVNLDALNDMNLRNIRLIAAFIGSGNDLPSLGSWAVNWSEVQSPILIDRIFDIEIPEDVRSSNIVNLSHHFMDKYGYRNESKYTMGWVSDTTNITLGINGSRMDVMFIRENWTGNVSLTVKCTNVYGRYAISNLFNITVANVNDAPRANMISPADFSILTETEVTLSWNATDIDDEFADISFDLYFSDDPSAPLYEANIRENSYTLTSLKDSTKYYWFVVPYDGEDFGPLNITPWSFTMNTAAVELLTPADSVLINSTVVNLTWDIRNTEDDWLEYHVYLGDSSDDLEELNVTARRKYSMELPPENHTYYWKIVAEFMRTGRLIGSETRSFSLIEQFTTISDVRLSLDRTNTRITKGESQVIRLNVSNHGNRRETVMIELLGGLKGHIQYNPMVVVDPGKHVHVDLNITAGELLFTDTYLLTIMAEYSGGTEEIKLSIQVMDPEVEHEKTDSDMLIRISAGTLLFLLIFIIILIVLKRKRRRREEIKKKAEESAVKDKELSDTEKTDTMRFSAGTSSDQYSTLRDIPPPATERRYPSYPADSHGYDFFAPSAPREGIDVSPGIGEAALGSMGEVDVYLPRDVKDVSALPTYDVEVLLPESPPLAGDSKGEVSLLSSGPEPPAPVPSESPVIDVGPDDELGTSAPTVPSYETSAPTVQPYEPEAPAEPVTIEEPVKDIAPEMPPTEEEEIPAVLDDYGDISSEPDDIDEPSSILSDDEHVLDSFSKFLQQMPSSLPSKEQEK